MNTNGNLCELQDAQNKSLEKYQGMKEKLQQLGRSLNNTQIQLATQEEATRCARLNSIEWEHKAEELQGRAIDLSSQVSVLLAEKNNAIEFRDTTLSELKRVTSERTALAARLDILESKHKTDASKTETEGILAQGEVQSSVNAALARIGEDIQSMAQQAAYHKNLEVIVCSLKHQHGCAPKVPISIVHLQPYEDFIEDHFMHVGLNIDLVVFM